MIAVPIPQELFDTLAIGDIYQDYVIAGKVLLSSDGPCLLFDTDINWALYYKRVPTNEGYYFYLYDDRALL